MKHNSTSEHVVEILVIYGLAVSSVAFVWGIYEILNVFTHIHPYLAPLILISMYPFLKGGNMKNRGVWYLFFMVLSFFAVVHIPMEPADFMGGFSLIVASSLVLAGYPKAVKHDISGLSFYLVGMALLIAISVLQILVYLADMLDYIINCIGENCALYSQLPRPEVLLFFLIIPLIYLLKKGNFFGGEVIDKESS